MSDEDRRGTGLVVGAVAAVHVLVLLVLAGRYGFHRDELYFVEAGQHLALGYTDQGPLTPLVARLSQVFGDGPAALRVVPALASGATVVLAAIIARELGGSRRAQVLAAAVTAGAGFVLGVGHLLSTATFDLLAWVALLAIAARILRTGEPRWWLAFGAVTGVALWNKQLVVLLAASLAAGLVVDRRWALLRTRWLLAGGGLALLLASPTLVWQAANGWPQLEMADAIAERIGGENRALLLPGQLYLLGPLLIGFLVAGARWLAVDAEGRRYRPLLWAWPVALAATLLSGGRPYYPLALTLTVVLAGTVATDRWMRTPSRRRWITAVVALNALTALPISLPVLPIDWVDDSPGAALNDQLAETVGWPELADDVAAVVAGLPADERDRAVLLTLSYGEAGALDRFGPERDLPPVYSGHNSYWDWRRPTDDGAPVVTVRYPPALIERHFESCEEVARVDNGRGIDNEAQDAPILICRGLRGSWSDVWPTLQRLS
ncbi:glycosyltransferase family 39 protein [soil metagenome]